MKSSAKNSDSVDNSDEDVNNRQMDLSILRKPITTSISSFLEVKKTYDNGTAEVICDTLEATMNLEPTDSDCFLFIYLILLQIKKLLAHECDIIYECKVCRSIFRSLVNFISHKRLYCRDFFNTSHHFHFRSNGFIVSRLIYIVLCSKFIINHLMQFRVSFYRIQIYQQYYKLKMIMSIIQKRKIFLI